MASASWTWTTSTHGQSKSSAGLSPRDSSSGHKRALLQELMEYLLPTRTSDAKALAYIGMTLTEQYLPTFSECETAKQAWDAFGNLFRNKSQARRMQLKADLSSLSKQPGEPLVKFFARAKHLKSQLLSVGTTLADDELALSVLNGLPAEYKTLRTVLTATESSLNLDDLLPKLLVVENENDKPVPESKAYVARPGNGQASRRQGGSSGQKPKEIRKCHHNIVARLGISRKTAGSVSVRSRAPAAHKARGRMAMAGEHKAMWPVQPYRQLREKLGSLTQELQDISP